VTSLFLYTCTQPYLPLVNGFFDMSIGLKVLVTVWLVTLSIVAWRMHTAVPSVNA